MLSPFDIANKEFRGAFRGYNQVEVDDFLEEVVREYEQILAERDEMGEKLEGLNQRLEYYRSLEETLNQTLLIAQGTAEEVKNNAHKEADLILKEARHQADKIIAEGKTRLDGMETGYQGMRQEIQLFRTRLKSMLKSQMDILEAGDWPSTGG